MKIDLRELTTCGVKPNGEAIELGFVDASGASGILQMSFDHAQSVAMTLPRLLAEALRRLTGSAEMRYVFPLDDWQIETVDEQPRLIVTFLTGDGFEVSFGIPFRDCGNLARGLQKGADEAPPAECRRPRDPALLN